MRFNSIDIVVVVCLTFKETVVKICKLPKYSNCTFKKIETRHNFFYKYSSNLHFVVPYP